MSINYNDPPVFSLPAYEPMEEVSVPQSALPLEKPLLMSDADKQYMLKPKPWRILQNVRSISSSHHHNLAIDRNDVLWTWGATELTQLEDGYFSYDAPQKINPVPQQCMKNVMTACAGAWYTLSVTKDGRLWGWGENNSGQLGQGDREARAAPVFIMDGVRFVYANEEQSYAVKEDGGLWGWGYNEHSILLDAPEYCTVPVRLLDDVESVCGGPDMVFAIKKDHTLWAWGFNQFNKIIPGKEVSIVGPTELLTGVRTVAVSKTINDDYCLVIFENGDLYSCGSGGCGSLLTYQQRDQMGPGPVKVMQGVADVSIGHTFSLIRLEDGRLYGWGDNALGQCGNGKSTGFLKKPTLVMTDVIDMEAVYTHGMALQRNGDLWIWGGDYGIVNRRCPR